jgi:hypothetical protein
MDTVMKVWIVGCMLLFTMRQFLPEIDKAFNIMGLIALTFGLLMAWILGTVVYRNVKEGISKRAAAPGINSPD